MKLFDKIKTILFEEEEVDVPVIKKEEPKEEVKEFKPVEQNVNVSRFKNVNYEREPLEQPKEAPAVKEKSPFQQFDEEEFERIAALNKSRLIERDRRAREEKEKEKVVPSFYEERFAVSRPSRPVERPVVHERTNVHLDNAITRETVNETKHFIPSPVISPVYGILDKNYKKEDILPKASSDGTLPKVIDVDSVRKKAFGALEEDIIEAHKSNDENESFDLLEETSDVIQGDDDDYMNTSDIKITTFEDEIDNDNAKVEDSIISNENDIINEEEVSNDIDEIDLGNDNQDLDTIISEDQVKDEIKEDKKEEDTLESDLFNLIDSMYQDKEENK